ncbi:hypothetical protein Goarm_022139 [Gossypium armourianum]|uniref:Uncharacterized protein n=1 Tax=Gossypium armourianum TaxID=34283 RepID=A0A7J9KG70_9ROSI|nr:hypothetical protein [Gossypium armourianum]
MTDQRHKQKYLIYVWWDISDLGEKQYLFRFYNKVVNGVPWAFNNHLLVFHRLENNEDPMQDNPIEGLDGKKRLRTPKSTTNVSGFIDALGVTDESIHAYCTGSLAAAKEQADRSLLYGDKIGFAENGGSSWKVWFSTWYCRTDWKYEGGLRLGWRTNVSVSLRSYSRYYNDEEVHDENFNGNWRMTGFYGSSDMRYRIEVWDDLKGLGQAPLKWEPPY